MNMRMRELLAKIEAKQKEARSYMDGENKDVNKAVALLDECDTLKTEYETEKRLFEAEKAEAAPEVEKKAEEKKQTDSVKAFADAARHGFQKDMREGVFADGGYVVPEDIVTRIERYRDAKASLREHVRVIPVQTASGARTFKKRSDVTGFAKVLENGKFAKKATPQFERLEYKIDKFGGYFVLSDEIQEDSDENVVNLITEMIGDEARVTDNVQILEAIKAVAYTLPRNFNDLNGIKEVLNVDLGQAFKATSKIYTNDNGLQWLDTLIDGNGRPLLSASPADPMKMQIACGATVVPLVVLPNADFPNVEQGIPFIVGDLYEGFAIFDRRRVTLHQSATASVEGYNAFEQGGLLIRADERADYVVRDQAAFYMGYIVPESV